MYYFTCTEQKAPDNTEVPRSFLWVISMELASATQTLEVAFRFLENLWIPVLGYHVTHSNSKTVYGSYSSLHASYMESWTVKYCRIIHLLNLQQPEDILNYVENTPASNILSQK